MNAVFIKIPTEPEICRLFILVIGYAITIVVVPIPSKNPIKTPV